MGLDWVELDWVGQVGSTNTTMKTTNYDDDDDSDEDEVDYDADDEDEDGDGDVHAPQARLTTMKTKMNMHIFLIRSCPGSKFLCCLEPCSGRVHSATLMASN